MKSEQFCHVNLLKPYFSRNRVDSKTSAELTASEGDGIPPGEKEVEAPANCVLQTRLTNSETLCNLENLMSYLSTIQQGGLIKVMHECSALFGGIPSRTHLIEHDVNGSYVLPFVNLLIVGHL